MTDLFTPSGEDGRPGDLAIGYQLLVKESSEASSNGKESSDSTCTVEFLRSAIDLCLRNKLLENALFLAERLHAEVNDESSLYTVCDCHFQLNDIRRAYFLLLNCKSPPCRFLLAHCCLKLDKADSAVTHLLASQPAPTASSSLSGPQYVPDPAAWHYLLAISYKRINDTAKATQHFARSLLLNPFIYLAYDELCRMGKNVPSQKVFKEGHHLKDTFINLPTPAQVPDVVVTQPAVHDSLACPQSTVDRTGAYSHGMTSEKSFKINSRPLHSHINSPSECSFVAESPYERLRLEKESSLKLGSFQTPLSSWDHQAHSSPKGDTVSYATTPISNHSVSNKVKLDVMPSISSYIKQREPKIPENGNRQENNYLSYTTPTLNKIPMLAVDAGLSDNSFGPPPLGISSAKKAPQKEEQATHRQRHSAFNYILKLFSTLGEAHRHACFYKMDDAILELKNLPRKHYETTRVLLFVARCLQEQRNFVMAEKIYLRAKVLDPYLLNGMEYYSSVLWHGRRVHDLTFLAHELLDLDPLSPSAWCTAGNAYSSRSDHRQAIECFMRAVSLKSDDSYAYLCLGYEFLALNDFEMAEKYFTRVLTMDERHYIARYGIGLLYFKREEYGEALMAWKAAAEINPTHSVLFSCLGMALHGMGQIPKALKAYEKALVLDPEDTLAQFKRGCLLLQLNRWVEAKETFKVLLKKLPKEALVKSALAHVHNLMNDQVEAVRYTAMAESLDARASITFQQVLTGRPSIQMADGNMGQAMPF